MLKIVVAVVLQLLIAIGACAQEPLDIPVYQGSIAEYERFVAAKGGDPLAIHKFDSGCTSRPVVEMVLLQQALRLGGLQAGVQFVPVPNTARGESLLHSGKAVMLGYSIWQSSFDDRTYMSDAVIRSGEFLKVIVGRADAQRLKTVGSLDALKKFVAVTGDSWTEDTRTLRAMGIENIQTVPIYDLQFACLAKKRADFGLFEYSGSAMAPWLAEHGLAMVPGITVGITGSRHFMVSKAHPAGKAVFDALQSGLAQLRTEDTFRKAYEACGFAARKIAGWKRIYPPVMVR